MGRQASKPPGIYITQVGGVVWDLHVVISICGDVRIFIYALAHWRSNLVGHLGLKLPPLAPRLGRAPIGSPPTHSYLYGHL